MTPATRPVPVADEISAPFWEAAARHVLVLAQCAACGTFTHPPDAVCRECGRADAGFDFAEVVGVGIVRSWTVMRQSFLPGFDDDVPFVLVDVELADPPGIRLIGRLLDGPEASLWAGAPVRVAFEDLGPGCSVPAFELVASEDT
ncbi:MAG TPA: OB-fold domain-containing protein [Acidimicrobiales bacterium]|nr:OB-fold domain-containing protein [Acidimicrobiales bacterium]